MEVKRDRNSRSLPDHMQRQEREIHGSWLAGFTYCSASFACSPHRRAQLTSECCPHSRQVFYVSQSRQDPSGMHTVQPDLFSWSRRCSSQKSLGCGELTDKLLTSTVPYGTSRGSFTSQEQCSSILRWRHQEEAALGLAWQQTRCP